MYENAREISAGLELIDNLDDTRAQMADVGQQLIRCNREITGDNLVGESAKNVADFEAAINGIVQAVKETNKQVTNNLESSWAPR
ncbi:Uncharacterised protein [Mycobacteroides abscessus subsp. abscessus]|uniref:hypothetical protein n=1 Tax=Mycobacteroides abscessus TaxID=36809 RepID=UPI0009289D1D|nr:hypothetical protein [Mycobacteroides abscessus]SIM03721.1 Uncharacterised protein [Mycobacteroides abscessus subsp. abscessus]SLC78150.1 Uncharacterised protein [Mycobacteroides abscessus subsp. abscessus]